MDYIDSDKYFNSLWSTVTEGGNIKNVMLSKYNEGGIYYKLLGSKEISNFKYEGKEYCDLSELGQNKGILSTLDVNNINVLNSENIKKVLKDSEVNCEFISIKDLKQRQIDIENDIPKIKNKIADLNDKLSNEKKLTTKSNEETIKTYENEIEKKSNILKNKKIELDVAKKILAKKKKYE